MYNRYVPGHDGTYHRKTVGEIRPAPCCEEVIEEAEIVPEQTQTAKQQRPCRNAWEGFDLGDLLLLCIVILLLLDSDEEDSLPLLIMAAAFLFLQ